MLLFFYKAKSRQIVDKEVAYAIHNFKKNMCSAVPCAATLPPSSFLLLFPALNSQSFTFSPSALLVVPRPKLNHILFTFVGGSPSFNPPCRHKIGTQDLFLSTTHEVLLLECYFICTTDSIKATISTSYQTQVPPTKRRERKVASSQNF